jgi:MoaA/NifB/PqqE/SkfB family radical SAM enzyme
MALGLSGSNGGITNHQRRITLAELERVACERFLLPPLEVSYFANNICNLHCRHCYVGYEREQGGLGEVEWADVFEQCLALGALTFGNVGKEATLCWDKSISLMRWLADRRCMVSRLRFGLVTNAILLDERKIADLAALAPDYLDISLDGAEEVHDSIRGKGSYRQTTQNIAALPPELKEKVFVSFTANGQNADSLPALMQEVARLGVRNILVSPYVSRENRPLGEHDALLAPDHRLVRLCLDLAEGRLVGFSDLENFNIYVKNDYSTRLSLQDSLAQTGVIDFENLWEDDYGVIFTPYRFGTNLVHFSYLPFETSYRKAIRFSHDGFIGNCYDMFFRDYPERTVGNVRNMRLAELYQKLENEFFAASLVQRDPSISHPMLSNATFR